jgi:hypothetical protein
MKKRSGAIAMWRNRKWLGLLAGGVVFLAGLLWTARVGRRGESIVEVQIPEETKQYLQQLARQIGDLRFIPRSGSGRNRSNREDDDKADERGFRRLADARFLVYYHDGWRERADEVMDFAEASERRMRLIFRYFPDPADHNGRKVPMYLCATEQEYYRISGVGIGSAGSVVWDVYDDAIIPTLYLNPVMYRGPKDFPRQVSVHELAHCTHVYIIAVKNLRNIRVWFREGLASYTADQQYRLQDLGESYRRGRVIPLTTLDAYPDGRAYASSDLDMFYAEGHSAMKMIEDRFGPGLVADVVGVASREADFGGASRRVLNLPMAEFDRQWQEYIHNQYAR